VRIITTLPGRTSTADYDLLNRPKTLSYGVSGTSSESTVTFAYGTTDRLKTLTDTAAAGPTGFGYDTLDRVTQVTQASGTTDYTYDAGDRRKTMTVTG
jgi:YD repeat-containing protein